MRAREALTAASSRPSLWGHQSGRREAHKPAVIGKLGQRRTENRRSSRHERRTIWPSFAGLNPKLRPGTLYVGYRNACLPLAVFDTHSYCTRKSFAVQGRGRVAFETAVTTGDPDPGRAATTEELGRELTLARLRAGLTVRQVAKAAEIPVSTAGDYFAGRHLPSASQSDALRKIVSCLRTVHAGAGRCVGSCTRKGPASSRAALSRRARPVPRPSTVRGSGRAVVLRPGRARRPPGQRCRR